MDFALLPPEVNSGLMYSGPGAGPMLSNAAGWDALAAELESAAAGYSSQIAGLTAQAWSGPSSVMMTAAATPYVQWLQASAAAAGQTAAQAYTAAAAYEAAFAMTVPPPVVAANRAQLMALIATNFLGQNTPAIAATEAQYAEMWVQDATAMYGYAADAEVASTLDPYSEPPQTTKPGGQGAQARAVAQTAGDTTNAARQVSTAVNAGGGNIIVNSGSTLTIDAGTTTTIGPGNSIIVQSGGTLIINGTLNISGGTVTVNGNLIVNGTLTVGSGTVTVQSGGILLNTGSLTVSGGSLTVGSAGSLVNAGSIAVNGGTLAVNGAVTIGPGGVLILHGGTLAIHAGGAVTLQGGTFTVNGGILGVDGTLTIGPGGIVTVVPHGAVLVDGTISVDGGSLIIESGATVHLTVNGGSLVIGPGEIITVGPGGLAGPVNYVGPVTVAPGAPAEPSWLSSLLGAPGLAGTSGIQPQLNVDALLDAFSGAD